MPKAENLTRIGSKIKVNLEKVRDRITPDLIKNRHLIMKNGMKV